MSFKENIEEIGKEINLYRTETRESLFTKCVDEKLKYNLSRYIDNVNSNSDLLLKRQGWQVFKALTKVQKEDDKAAILAQMDMEGESHD